MRRFLLSTFLCLAAAPLFAAEPDPRFERAVREAMPVCGDTKITYEELPISLPARFNGVFVRLDSGRHPCKGQYAAIFSPSGSFYFGMPWMIATEEGKTIEEKLRSFTWRNLQENVTPVVDRTRNHDGLFPVTLMQVVEGGKLPMYGQVDPEGKIFFFGSFRRDDIRTARAKAFDEFVANSPSLGSADAAVTIIEFSDFQCPSCKRSAGFVDPILAEHGDQVRYVRFDLPLSGHAWALPAAVAGRAIHIQKPDLFWEFKKQIYENQSSFNAFTFWDWARGFAEDHDLDMARYDADAGSEEIRAAILRGAGVAFSNDVRATPTYIVNGAVVDAGDDGKALAAYVAGLLK